MSDSTSNSVSKGVFVFKKKAAVANAEDYFCDGDSTSKLDEDQYIIYDELRESINSKIQILQSNLNTKIFDDLLEYVQNAYSGFSLDSAECARKTIQEIPAAALVTGVNVPDHGVMFSNLVSLLKERTTPHVAVLKSKDCPTLRNMMSQMMAQLMSNYDQLDDDDENEEIVPKTKRVNCTMPVLAAWYRSTVEARSEEASSGVRSGKTAGSPRKRRRVETFAPPIVVVLEDLERFPPQALQDFIVICSSHLARLPVVLVFGIATAVSVVHRLLCDSVSAHLSMEKFQAPPSTQCLANVIDQVVMSPEVPFKLGPKVLDLLLDIFLYHDFSVVSFVRGFQFALMDHFYSSPHSVLCQSLKHSLSQLRDVSVSQLDLLRTCPSFRRFVENKQPQQQISLLEDAESTKKTMATCLRLLSQHSFAYFPVLRCLHTFVCKLPHYPLGKYLREVYALSLSKNVCDTPAYQEAINLIKTLCRDELLLMLTECRTHLSGSDTLPTELVSACDELRKLGLKFENIEELAREYEERCDTTGSEPDVTELPKKMDMYTLRQTLTKMEKKKKKRTVYEVLREETVHYMDTLFKKYLLCPSHLVLHEVFYYNDVATLKSRINASPRSTIQRGLANPYVYLQCEALKLDGCSISAALPDICIAYKLHLECGRLINLYDWLQAFIMIVKSNESEDDDESNRLNKPDLCLQARFIRAVSELQFVGFIKPTKRKTDHVARLTW